MIDYYRVTNPEGLCILVDLANDIEDMVAIMLEEIEENAPLKRCEHLENTECRKLVWCRRSDYVHAMTSALFTMISELHSSLTELDNICNSPKSKKGAANL